MKKLMIAAAAAAMVGSGFAATKEALKAQVYDFTATLKTTQCNKSGKSYEDACHGSIYYREQLTQKLYGKFWGCHCQVIANPGDANEGITCSTTGTSAYGMPRYIEANGVPADKPTATTDIVEKSCIFWINPKSEDGAFHSADWEWSLLQRVGKKGTNIEGAFNLVLNDCNGTQVADLAGAGYGTVVVYGKCDGNDYIKSMSGNIVGTWDIVNDTITSGCAYCGSSSTCDVVPFCMDVTGLGSEAGVCDDLSDNTKAVVFGSFTLKYNASEAKSVNGGKFIDELSLSSKKNKAVAAEFACIEEEAEAASKGVTPTPEEEKEDALKKAYTTAKTNYETAKATAEASAKAAAEAAASEYLKDSTTAATSTEGQKLAMDVTDALTKQDVAWKALVPDAKTYGNAVIAYNKAVEAYNTIKDDATKTNKEIEAAKTDMDNAEKAMNVAKAADSLTANDIKAADAWVELADKLDAAKDAVTEWETTGFAAAKEEAQKKADKAAETAADDAEKADAAETALNNADIACRVANVDCE